MLITFSIFAENLDVLETRRTEAPEGTSIITRYSKTFNNSESLLDQLTRYFAKRNFM